MDTPSSSPPGDKPGHSAVKDQSDPSRGSPSTPPDQGPKVERAKDPAKDGSGSDIFSMFSDMNQTPTATETSKKGQESPAAD
jgi:hypothetical protein